MFILPFNLDSVWVFKDSLNRVLFIRNDKFTYVSAFYNGVARFNINGKCNVKDECEGGYWGILDYKGKVLANNLEWISDFIGNYAIFQKGYKFGIIRKDGRIVVPAKLDEIIIIDENFLFYRIGDKWGIARPNGSIIYQAEFNGFIKLNDSLFLIIKGKECDIFNNCEASKYGIISKSGKFLIPLKFEGISEIKDSFVEINYDGKWGLMKLNGKTVIEPNYEDILYFKGFVWFKLDNKWGLMDLNKRIIIKPTFLEIFSFENLNYLKFKFNDKWGVVSFDGKIILNADFDNVKFLSDNYFLVEKDGFKGVVDEKGNVIIPLKYKDIVYGSGKFAFFDGSYWNYKDMKFTYLEIFDNIIIVQNNGFYGIIDTSGKIILNFNYDSLKFIDGLLFAKKGYFWSIFNKNFERIVEGVDSFEIDEDFVKFRKLNKWGLVDKNGKILLNPIYDYIDKLDDNGIFRVLKNGKFGLVRNDGKVLLEPKYPFIYKFYKNVYKLNFENGFDYFIVDTKKSTFEKNF